jgi:hypothetical protein
MGETFDKLMTLLKEKGKLDDADIERITKESGAMTAQEQLDLSAEQIKRNPHTQITTEQYLAAMKVLDTAAEGSPEYVAAEKVVNAFESGQ